MPKVHVILLAAGKSSRFGQNKLLIPVGTKPLYRHLPDLLERLPEDLIGLRLIVSRFPEILEPMKKKNYLCVTNEMPEYGISHSIFLGIQKILEQSAVKEEDALLFAVCDQPYLREETIEKLIRGFWESGKGIACACDAERSGNPVIFSMHYTKELLKLTGDQGGKQVLLKHPEDVYFCPVEEEKELMDIDTKETYKELCANGFVFSDADGRESSFLWELLFEEGTRQKPHIISIAGAGGKTTLAYELAREAKIFGKSVLVTTTTHMMRPKEAYYEWTKESRKTFPEEAGEIFMRPQVWTVGRRAGDAKICGIPEADQALLADLVDVLIVEADGSRQYPLKVPGEHEPVLYPKTDFFLGVMGYPAIGQTLGDAAHHPERAAEFLQVTEEHILTLPDLMQIMSSPKGLLKHVNTEYAVLLNRCPAGFGILPAEENLKGRLFFCEDRDGE